MCTDLPVAKMHKPYCTVQIFTPLVPSLVSHLILSNQKKKWKAKIKANSSPKSRQREGGRGILWVLLRAICKNLKKLLSVIEKKKSLEPIKKGMFWKDVSRWRVMKRDETTLEEQRDQSRGDRRRRMWVCLRVCDSHWGWRVGMRHFYWMSYRALSSEADSTRD